MPGLLALPSVCRKQGTHFLAQILFLITSAAEKHWARNRILLGVESTPVHTDTRTKTTTQRWKQTRRELLGQLLTSPRGMKSDTDQSGPVRLAALNKQKPGPGLHNEEGKWKRRLFPKLFEPRRFVYFFGQCLNWIFKKGKEPVACAPLAMC